MDATLVPRTIEGIGNREITEVPERKCPSCDFHEISITYDRDHIYCSACGYDGPPRYVAEAKRKCPHCGSRELVTLPDGSEECYHCGRQIEESFDSSSLGGFGVADMRTDPIPSSVPHPAEERGEEEPVDPEDESVVDAVIDPDHIHMKPDMFGTIPDSGMPSSVGSIGQMPIRLESVEISCSECGSATGGDGLCTDYTCLGSEGTSEVGDMTPPDPETPQGYDHHLDPNTPTNTMWRGLGDETPDYRV